MPPLPTELKAGTYTVGGSTVPQLSVSVARTSSGSLALSLVNLDPNQAISLTTTLKGSTVKQVKGSVLTAPARDARNTFEAPQAVQPKAFTDARLERGTLNVKLPAKSVVVLTLE